MNKVQNDREVIIKIKKGEIENFSFIVKKYTNRIYYFVSKRIRNREDVEDLIQQAFLKLYKAIDRFDVEKQVLPYLYQIARNEMKMFWRSQKKTVALDEKTIAEEESDDWIYKEDAKQLLGFLTSEEREILQSLSEGYSYREIAKELELPLNTVKTKVRRARLKIQTFRSGG